MNTSLSSSSTFMRAFKTPAMAEEYSRLTSSSVTLAATNKHLDKKRVLQFAQ